MRKGTSASQLQQHHHRFSGKIFSAEHTRLVAYVFLLFLSYSVGRYMSRVSQPSSSSSSQSSANPYLAPISTTTKAQSNHDQFIQIQVEHDLQEPEFERNDAEVKIFDDHNVFGTVCAADHFPNPELVRQTIIDRVFDGISPWKNFPPFYAANLLRKTRVQGWGSTGSVFGNLIRKVKPKTIIEVGSFLGASALHMVELTRQLGLPDTQILCVDDFRGWPGFQNDRWSRSNDIKMVNGDVMLLYQFMQNVVHANATESVMFLPFSTGSALDKLCEWGVYGDLIEVDAGHDFHSAWSDINRAYKILRPGGVLFGHDYLTAADNRGVRRAVNLFAKIKNLRVKVDGQHWVLHGYPDESE